MTEPVDFNEARRARAESERRFILGPYTFKRRSTIPPEVIVRYSEAGNGDRNALEIFEQAFIELVEPKALVTGTDELIDTADAWQRMRFQGDEYDVVSFEDLRDMTDWLVEGVIERPTGLPSVSPDGFGIPTAGMISTDTAPPAA